MRLTEDTTIEILITKGFKRTHKFRKILTNKYIKLDHCSKDHYKEAQYVPELIEALRIFKINNKLFKTTFSIMKL